MKNIVLRSVVIACILTAAVAVLVWYFSMRRELPEHARVIPEDAFAVITLNLRELANDRSGNDHLYPEMEDESMLQKELAPFNKAVTANGATGFEETADVLVFAYHSGEAAFFGMAIQLEDSATFGNLMRVHVSREYNIQPWTSSGVPVVRFDTTAAVIGWTEDVALFLYPLGHHGIASVSQQCIQLLKQDAGNSVLENEDFCEHQLKAFDVALWLQSEPFTQFTGGGDLVEQIMGDVMYYNYFADFTDGEILIRSEWHLQDETVQENIAEIAFPCEAKDIRGFIRTHFNVKNDSMYEHYADSPVMSSLPLNDDECIQLLPYLTGDAVSITHDTLTYTEEYFTRSFDQDFNRIDVPHERQFTVVTRSTSFKVADPAKVAGVLNAIMARDSIPLTTRGWVYKEAGLETRMILTDDLLTVTNFPGADGRGHPVPQEMAGYMAWFDLHSIFGQKDAGVVSWFIPSLGTAYDELSKNLLTMSSTVPIQMGNVRRSEISVKFQNTEINALVQAEEILRKIYFTQPR